MSKPVTTTKADQLRAFREQRFKSAKLPQSLVESDEHKPPVKPKAEKKKADK